MKPLRIRECIQSLDQVKNPEARWGMERAGFKPISCRPWFQCCPAERPSSPAWAFPLDLELSVVNTLRIGTQLRGAPRPGMRVRACADRRGGARMASTSAVQLSGESYLWDSADSPVRILLSLDVVERLRAAVLQEFGGAERQETGDCWSEGERYPLREGGPSR